MQLYMYFYIYRISIGQTIILLPGKSIIILLILVKFIIFSHILWNSTSVRKDSKVLMTSSIKVAVLSNVASFFVAE